ncbi:hypothetical protein CALCODRAFT_482545 [Calocera cornea HHB12733]|uniref:Uncharacterized protein n=1 Tax=Calocera cornea HHB12733 TaxID=1353952 RepID=A0A165GJG2_9BASI|nr:hypothetical protein CALCODRAFT_482545 [Calocera cornea HHB12733]
MSGRDMPAYDANLLAQAPEPTKEQKQSGYQTKGLLDEPRVASPSRSPAPVVPEAGASASNGRSVDLLEKGSIDERPVAAAAAPAAKRPWYRTPKGWIIIGVILAAIIIAAVVGGVVGSRNAHSNNSDTAANTAKVGSGGAPSTTSGASSPSSSGSSSAAPGASQIINTSVTPTQSSTSATDAAVGEAPNTNTAASNTDTQKPGPSP